MKALRRLGKTARTFLLVTLLGYDVDPKGSKLGVNEEEASRMQSIFELYRKHRGANQEMGFPPSVQKDDP